MPAPQMQDMNFTLKFGGGINSAASEDDVAINECTVGQNFVLDFKNKNLKPRPAIEKLGTAPNVGRINGFVNLVDADGVSTILVQAGDKLYQWASDIGFISKATVSTEARLRGNQYQYWPLSDVVLISDLAGFEPVMQWDGSAVTDMTHNLVGDFKAKYILIDNERAWYANVVSNSTATPHMLVVSKLSDNETLSISDRPSSSLGADDPYYLLTPDLRAINGMAGFFGNVSVSSQRGSMFTVTGNDSNDTAIKQFYPQSYATGDESLQYVGNDLTYGRLGRVEALTATDAYGDVATDDLTAPIKDQITMLSNWKSAYNSRTQKIYYYSDGSDELWQFSKDTSQEVSPWVKIVTNNAFNMQITCIMALIDPIDNLEYTFMGDASGNIYRIEGQQGAQDCGANDIITSWRSGILKLPNMYQASHFDGYISYRAGADTEITIKFIFGGSNSSISTHTVPLKGASGGDYFGGDIYFGQAGKYFGAQFTGSFKRESVIPAGESEELQIEVSHEGTAFFEINEIGVRFTAKTSP